MHSIILSKKNKVDKESGVITIYVSIIFMVIICFFFTLIDVSRINVAKNQIVNAADNALESGMGGFSRDLYNSYGVFAMPSNNASKGTIEEVFKKNITPTDDVGASGYVDLLNLNSLNSEILFGKNPFIDNKVMKEQMCNATRYYAVKNFFQEILNDTGILEKLKTMINSKDEIIAVDKMNSLNSLMETIEKEAEKIDAADLAMYKLVHSLAINGYHFTEFGYYKDRVGDGKAVEKWASGVDKNVGKAIKKISNIVEPSVDYPKVSAYQNTRMVFIGYKNILEEDKKDNQKEIDSNNSEISNINTNLSAKKDQKKEKDKKLKELKDKLKDAKETEVESIEKEIKEVEKEVLKLKNEIDKLSKDKSSASNKVKELNKNNKDIDKKISVIDISIGCLSAEASKSLDAYTNSMNEFMGAIDKGITATNSLMNEKSKDAQALAKHVKGMEGGDEDLKKELLRKTETKNLASYKTYFGAAKTMQANFLSKLGEKSDQIDEIATTIDNNNSNKLTGTAKTEVQNFINTIVDSNNTTKANIENKTKDLVKGNKNSIIKYDSSWYKSYKSSIKEKLADNTKIFKEVSAKVGTWMIVDNLILLPDANSSIFRDAYNSFKDMLKKNGGVLDKLVNKYPSKNFATQSQINNLPHQTSKFTGKSTATIRDRNGKNIDIIYAKANPEIVHPDDLHLVKGEGGFKLESFMERLLKLEIPDDWSFNGLAGSFADKLFMMEYVMTYFKSMVDEGRVPTENSSPSVLEYEIESMLSGGAPEYNDFQNKWGITSDLLLMRVALNGVYFFSDRKMNDTADIIGTSISLGISFMTLGTVVLNPRWISTVIKMAWIYMESRLDVIDLLNGYKVPLIKNFDTWIIKLNNSITSLPESTTGITSEELDRLEGEIEAEGSDKVLKVEEKTEEPNNNQSFSLLKFTYTDFLRFRLFLLDEGHMIDRTQDLIALNLGNSNGTFNYREYASEASIEAEVGMGKWFGNSVFKGSEDKEKHKFNAVKRKRSYR
ncbi:DUF5702 domain-containing protein [Clostridium chrysemydis]|uniref:DUF5702 domain-containing protein n=2 Tax=Clostridium chrysemydis TaxID=2665504 RepID=UPI0018833B39|nr:DUF5702 domain-containing protein [Clostridium chrysemydis]